MGRFEGVLVVVGISVGPKDFSGITDGKLENLEEGFAVAVGDKEEVGPWDGIFVGEMEVETPPTCANSGSFETVRFIAKFYFFLKLRLNQEIPAEE